MQEATPSEEGKTGNSQLIFLSESIFLKREPVFIRVTSELLISYGQTGGEEEASDPRTGEAAKSKKEKRLHGQVRGGA